MCGGVATLELVNVKLALAAGVVHVANLAKDGPLCPALVVNATDGPQAACQAQGHKCQLSPSQAPREQVGCGCKAE